MKTKIVFVLICALLLSLLNGCGSTGDTDKKESEIAITENNLTSENSYSDLYDGSTDDLQKSYGQFGFGINTNLENVQEDENGTMSFEYNGEEIRIPYYVENLDPEVNAEFGLLAFIDGYIQTYRIEDVQGNVLYDASYMKKFNLEPGDKEEFYLIFTPVSGKEGNTVSFITATILQPDFIAETNNYGIYYSLSATIPQQIVMKQSVENKITSYTEVNKEDISNEIIEKLESTSAGQDISEMLNNTFICELKPADNTENNIAYLDNGTIHLKFLCYGGPEVLYRMNLFINNEPVDMNGCSFIEFHTETDKMISGEIEIDASSLSLQEYNTIYAVFMTGEQDYTIANINASEPLLLKEEIK